MYYYQTSRVRTAGKSFIIKQFAKEAGYLGTGPNNKNHNVELVCCYKDMTGRDLVERRSTDAHGNTEWRLSGVVQAALDGSLVILDGIDRLSSDALSVLASLIRDRELHLPDGRRLLRHDRFDAIVKQRDLSLSEMRKQGILKIDPNFRLAALSLPPTRENPLSSEFLSLFPFVEVLKPLKITEKMTTVASESQSNRYMISVHDTIIRYCDALEKLSNGSQNNMENTADSGSQLSPSLRQLQRLWNSMISKVPSLRVNMIITIRGKLLP